MTTARFLQKRLTIGRLEMEVRPEVAGVASGETLRSDDPAVVSVTPMGALVAHKAGTVTVRSVPDPDSKLAVEVRPVRSLRFEPASLALHPNSAERFSLLGDGEPLDPSAVDWSIDKPMLVRVQGPYVHAFSAEGSARVTAKLGEMGATLEVAIGAPAVTRTLSAPPFVRLGEIRQVQLAPPSTLPPGWSTSRPKVLASLGRGFFHALAPGRSEVWLS